MAAVDVVAADIEFLDEHAEVDIDVDNIVAVLLLVVETDMLVVVGVAEKSHSNSMNSTKMDNTNWPGMVNMIVEFEVEVDIDRPVLGSRIELPEMDNKLSRIELT